MTSTSGTTAVNLLVVDDDADMLRLLTMRLTAAGYHVTAVTSAEAALTQIQLKRPQLVLSDVQLPGMDGLALLQYALETDPKLPVILITGHGDIPSSVRAIKDGAVDFLTKPFSDADLMAAIHAAIAQDREKRLERAELGVLKQRYLDLTPRERQVLPHVIAGRLNKQIAADLGISLKTTKVHRSRIMLKFGVRSVAALVRLAELAHVDPGGG